MTEDGEPSPAPASPFEPERAGPGLDLRRPALVGCGVGCSVLLALGIVFFVVLSLKTGEVWSWSLQVAHETLLAAAPDDWSELEDAELRAAFEEAGKAIADNRAYIESSLDMYQELMSCLQKATRRELERSDLLKLARVLRAVAGERAPPPRPGGLVIRPASREAEL